MTHVIFSRGQAATDTKHQAMLTKHWNLTSTLLLFSLWNLEIISSLEMKFLLKNSKLFHWAQQSHLLRVYTVLRYVKKIVFTTYLCKLGIFFKADFQECDNSFKNKCRNYLLLSTIRRNCECWLCNVDSDKVSWVALYYTILFPM